MPESTMRPFTVSERAPLPGSARSQMRLAMLTARRTTLSGRNSTSPLWTPARTFRPIPLAGQVTSGYLRSARNLIRRLRRGRQVLILRPDHLGDVVLFSGALHHLRAHYPSDEITVYGLPAGLEYLQHCPHVDRLLAWPPTPPRRPLARRSMVLLPVRSPTLEHHELMGCFPATEKYGIAGDFSNQSVESDEAAHLLYTSRLALDRTRRSDHELVVTRDFLRHLGISVELADVFPEAWTTPADSRWAEAHVPRSADGITLAIAPGVTNPKDKIYPPDRYPVALAQVWSAPAPVDAVIFGGSDDRVVCSDVAGRLKHCAGLRSVIDLAGKTTVRQMIEGLRRADVVLSADAAPLHVATALGRPTVGIMGGGHFGRFYPWGDPEINRVVNRPMDCYWCDWRCRYPTFRCVEEIAPAAVAHELRAAIAAGARLAGGRG